MKLRVTIFIFLLLKVSLSTAFCQVKCSADDSCCKQSAQTTCEEDFASLPDQPTDSNTDEAEDCQCPACHAHIVMSVEATDAIEVSEMTENLHHWCDSLLDPFRSGVFHPPCPLLS